MPSVFVRFQAVSPEVALEVIIAKLVGEISGTQITDADWYATRRAREEAVIEKLVQRGRPRDFFADILASIDRAAKRTGPRLGIRIAMGDGGVFDGNISRSSMLLHSDGPIEEAAVDRVLDVLRPLGIVKDLQVSGESRPTKDYDDE
jgi:hypothetical protein